MATVFFDLDGTLIDPVLGITRSIQHALTCVGLHATDFGDLRWCIGPPLLDSFKELVGGELASKALGHYRDRFGRTGLYESALYPGVTCMLVQLNQAGVRLYVASSKPHVYVERILDHFNIRSHFAGVYGSELDGTRTDKTELLRYALKSTGSSPGSSTMVGDRRHDIVGAFESGISDRIGVLYGYGSIDELTQAGASRLVGTPSDLINLLIR